ASGPRPLGVLAGQELDVVQHLVRAIVAQGFECAQYALAEEIVHLAASPLTTPTSSTTGVARYLVRGALIVTRSTSSCSVGRSWNAAAWSRGRMTYTNPGSGSGPRVRRKGWPAGSSDRSSSAVWIAMNWRRHSTVWPTNRWGCDLTSAADTPTSAPS